MILMVGKLDREFRKLRFIKSKSIILHFRVGLTDAGLGRK